MGFLVISRPLMKGDVLFSNRSYGAFGNVVGSA
jgi:hypothetical protein